MPKKARTQRRGEETIPTPKDISRFYAKSNSNYFIKTTDGKFEVRHSKVKLTSEKLHKISEWKDVLVKANEDLIYPEVALDYEKGQLLVFYYDNDNGVGRDDSNLGWCSKSDYKKIFGEKGLMKWFNKLNERQTGDGKSPTGISHNIKTESTNDESENDSNSSESGKDNNSSESDTGDERVTAYRKKTSKGRKNSPTKPIESIEGRRTTKGRKLSVTREGESDSEGDSSDSGSRRDMAVDNGCKNTPTRRRDISISRENNAIRRTKTAAGRKNISEYRESTSSKAEIEDDFEVVYAREVKAGEVQCIITDGNKFDMRCQDDVAEEKIHVELKRGFVPSADKQFASDGVQGKYEINGCVGFDRGLSAPIIWMAVIIRLKDKAERKALNKMRKKAGCNYRGPLLIPWSILEAKFTKTDQNDARKLFDQTTLGENMKGKNRTVRHRTFSPEATNRIERELHLAKRDSALIEDEVRALWEHMRKMEAQL